MKRGVRVLALDDSRYARGDRRDLVIGIIGREQAVEGAVSFYVDVDGNDATDALVSRMKRSRFMRDVRLIAVQGMTFAGLNIVDIARVGKELDVPVVAITRKRPHAGALASAMKAAGIADLKERQTLLKNILKETLSTTKDGFYLQYTKGIGEKELLALLPVAASLLRFAHIVASGISKGESKGR